MADHSQAPVTGHDRAAGRAGRAGRARPVALVREALARRRAADRRLSLPARRDGLCAARVRARRDARLGGQHARWRSRASTSSCGSSATRTTPRARGSSASPERGELRFAPGWRRSRTPAARRWSVDGRAGGARRSVRGRARCCTPAYPDALARACGRRSPARPPVRCCCRPAPGYEFIDWGRQAHVGGGSHGSLHASDSLGALRPLRGRATRARARPVGDPRRRPARAGALRPRAGGPRRNGLTPPPRGGVAGATRRGGRRYLTIVKVSDLVVERRPWLIATI